MERIFNKLDRYFYKKWHLAVLDMDMGRWVISPKVSHIPYLKAENANGRHILIQPDPNIAPYYLLVDDVNWPLIQKHHQSTSGKWKAGRMVIETSTHNYQVWVHSSRPLALDEKRYWLKKLKSDPGADPNNRWGRCPGFFNRKEKYLNATGGYPLSRLIWIDWKYHANIPVINSQTAINETIMLPISRTIDFNGHLKAIARSNYERNDESATDFAYALALFRRGYTDQYVLDRIKHERINWKNHSGEKRMEVYLNRTIKRAKDIVSSTKLK